MRPKSTISTPKVDDEHPHHFHTSFHCWERGCPSGNIESNLDITILYNENLSLGPGSVVGEKGKKRGKIGKYRGAKLAERYPGEGERAPPFPSSQATYRLASLHNVCFFSPTPIFLLFRTMRSLVPGYEDLDIRKPLYSEPI